MKSDSKKLSKSIQAIVALGLLGAATTASASCKTDAIGCAANTSGMLLACAAAAEGLGANPVFDYACYTEALAVVGSCNAMAESCSRDTTTNNPLTTSGGAKGTTSGTKQTITCGNISSTGRYENRVTGFYFKKDTVNSLTLISSIRMHCSTGGSAVFIGNDGTSGSTWTGGICGNGRLTQGMKVRSGAYIDGLTRICDTVGFSSTDSDNVSPSTTFGGTGGTESQLKCPEGKYIWA
ncbi:MAG: hypothetical protein HC938_13430 [Nitrospira sp.]|nr:hypothetical protein [Nitrospira sp.]